MSQVKWDDGISNEEVRKRSSVSDVVMKKHRLRWYGHVKRREKENILRRANAMEVKGKKTNRQTKKKLEAICNRRHEFGQY